MLKNLFPRLFGQFREGGIVHAKFVVGGNGGTTSTFALKTAVGTQNYQSLSMTRSAVGQITLVLAGGVRAMALLDATIVPVTSADASASYQGLRARPAFVEGTGTIVMRVLTNAGIAGGEMAFTAGDEVHATLYVDR